MNGSEGNGRSVLVAGATGFLGAAFVRTLVERGLRVVALGRDEARIRRRFDGLPVEGRTGDVTRPESLQNAFRDVDTVVQCVQFSGFPVEDPSRGLTFMAVDARGTRNVVDEARASGVRRLVYLSGVGADPSSDRSWYRAKGLAEESIRTSGLGFAIIRPSWVYGPEDRSLNLFIRALRLNPLFFPQIGDGKQRLNPLYVEDLASLVALVVGEGAAEGETVEVGGPVTYTLDDIIGLTMEVVARQRPIVHLPVGLVKAGACLAQLLPGQLLSVGAVDFLLQSAVADNARFRELFSIRLTPMPVALGRYATER
ncbi:MAG: NAD(P)H-binding protein [Gemmatimonadota bacterium]|jgi:NADH dehydrogenase|nr:MAG: NAD(P)H-binding protein [Gemmatimonadota bacterium]